jgi:predicted SAM-dependent methyltransferase
MNRKGDLTIDLREPLPFADGSARSIYSEHTLEHFYREHDAPNLLRECHRVLAPGGPSAPSIGCSSLAMHEQSARTWSQAQGFRLRTKLRR